jgi:hypothetical protein
VNIYASNMQINRVIVAVILAASLFPPSVMACSAATALEEGETMSYFLKKYAAHNVMGAM